MNENLYIEEKDSNLYNYLKKHFNIINISKSPTKILEIGNLYSPPFTSIFFKYTLGSYIEALNQGANIIVESENKYKDEFLFEYQLLILKSLGYKFKYIKIYKNYHISYMYIYKELNEIYKRKDIKFFYDIIKSTKRSNIKISLENILILGYLNKYTKKRIYELKSLLNKYKIKIQLIPTKISFTKWLFTPYYKSKIKKYLSYKKNIILTNEIYQVLIYSINHGRGIIYIQDELDIIETNIIPIIKRITQKYKIPLLIINTNELIHYDEDKIINFSNQVI